MNLPKIKPIDIEAKNNFLLRAHAVMWTMLILYLIGTTICTVWLYQEKKDILNVLLMVKAADVEIQKTPVR